MVIICPQCRTKHNIDEKQISSDMETARCKICGQNFLFHSEVITPDRGSERETLEVNSRVRKIGVMLSKGGVGKTTTAVNLSAGLALSGYKVLLVDTDTQGQASYMLGLKPESGLVELVTKELSPEETMVEARQRLWLLSGGRTLAGVKRLIDRKSADSQSILSQSLGALEHLFDFIILDTSPGWDALTVSVLFYIDELLIPISLDVMAIHGLVEFLNNISSIRRQNKKVALKYLLPTFLDNRTKKPTELLNQLKLQYKDTLCKPIR
ncbi:MAG: zinc-ribbon domain-containing protein, partial [Deltaproteobacteria bacterium]|nr:zinc-ribbon domain-containing protein [Deltaproteobacteria bacterium]